MQGPKGGAPASVRRFAPLSGLRSAPRALQCTPVSFFNCTTHREKSQDTQQKSQRYSANFTLLSQKQRRYAYDIHVYAKIGYTCTINNPVIASTFRIFYFPISSTFTNN